MADWLSEALVEELVVGVSLALLVADTLDESVLESVELTLAGKEGEKLRDSEMDGLKLKVPEINLLMLGEMLALGLRVSESDFVGVLEALALGVSVTVAGVVKVVLLLPSRTVTVAVWLPVGVRVKVILIDGVALALADVDLLVLGDTVGVKFNVREAVLLGVPEALSDAVCVALTV